MQGPWYISGLKFSISMTGYSDVGDTSPRLTKMMLIHAECCISRQKSEYDENDPSGQH